VLKNHRGKKEDKYNNKLTKTTRIDAMHQPINIRHFFLRIKTSTAMPILEQPKRTRLRCNNASEWVGLLLLPKNTSKRPTQESRNCRS
jgi:hypothetical protein